MTRVLSRRVTRVLSRGATQSRRAACSEAPRRVPFVPSAPCPAPARLMEVTGGGRRHGASRDGRVTAVKRRSGQPQTEAGWRPDHVVQRSCDSCQKMSGRREMVPPLRKIRCHCSGAAYRKHLLLVVCVARLVSHWRHIDCYTEQGWGNRDF